MDNQHNLVAGLKVDTVSGLVAMDTVGTFRTIFHQLPFIGNTLTFNNFGFLNCYPKKQKLLLFLISRMMAVI